MNKSCLKVGITGGIGSGKTFVSKLFKQLGIPVFNADEVAKQLMEQNAMLKSQISDLLGPNAYDNSGKLNRNAMAEKVFNSPELLLRLNALVHPAVINEAENWHLQQRNVPFTLKEAALLIESGSYKQLDVLIIVTAPEALRIQRVVDRDNVTASDVKLRMQKQLPVSTLLEHADFIIQNDGSNLVIPKVHQIYRQLLEKLD